MTPRAKFDRSLLPERPNLEYEMACWRQGFRRVAGVDEAGRGALAGPVAAGVVILPTDAPEVFEVLHGVRDSKEMTPQARIFWAGEIKALAFGWGVGMANPREIDQLGIVPATRLAVQRALAGINPPPDHLLVDYLCLPACAIPQISLVKGDARALSIACASILAKTSRDALLITLDKDYSGYGFAQHKGYGTASHRQAINTLGPCEIHRKTFSPIARYYSLFPPEHDQIFGQDSCSNAP